VIQIEEVVLNITNEILLVGSIYKKPDLFIEHGHNIRSKYDFYDEATKFFYDNAEILYQTRSQTFNRSIISAFMSEDKDRLSLYKKYGGWKTIEGWINLSVTENFQGYFEVLKKYSLLREYQRNGFSVEKIMSHPKFEMLTAMDIYRLIRSKADRIHTVILTNEEAERLNSNIKTTLLHCMETPDLGIKIPFENMNDMTRGLKKKSVMAVGMLSNAGKSRYMTKLIAYITLVLKEKVFVLLNEMTVEEIRYALITTVINNPEFQELHGLKLKKKEKELTLGLYKDKNGEFIYPEKDEWGDVTETIEEYAERVALNSTEYLKIMKIAEWIEDETQGLIYVKDVSAAYDDKTLEFEIRKANLTQRIEYFFYDTFKNDISSTGDWAAMKVTATRLTELAKQLDMFGYLSIQLTDDANHIKPDELTSTNIANCKAIKHVLHTLFLFKEIRKDEFKKYCYIANGDWGKPTKHELNLEKRYYCCVCDKNRFGAKKILLFEVNLDLNTWMEVGVLQRK
jgi:replicative DNA helicase